ncbi:protein PERCC1 [Platichthys flesus]|uniref:protein PERCC1 n=1 Tax=Platichthys flesus TaxID=8260 RepID=UPI002DB93E28|nr:protein PERCC1 [Platichthys flesus]
MAAGVIRNFLVQAQTPAYFPMIYQSSPCKDDIEMEGDDKQEEREEEREDEEDREDDEDDEESDAQEEEEEDDCSEEGLLNPAPCALDVTKQLLTFADLISRDVQRYFGRCSGDHEARDIYSDSVSAMTGGRLRYYDDLLRIARAGSPEEPESGSSAANQEAVGVSKGNSVLGPLAELFDHVSPSLGRGRPMVKRHLPLSFWTEPIPCCSLGGFTNTPDVTNTNTPSQGGAHTDNDTHMPFNTDHNAHGLENNQLDFSDLLAYWDPNPELTHTLTETTHMQH